MLGMNSFTESAFRKKILIVWDLDLTLVDSSHRTRIDKNGKFDIDYWIKNSTPEKIKKDTLLPLVSVYQGFKNSGFTQILITARVMNEADYEYLRDNNLTFDMILHRENSLELSNVLKSSKIKKFLKEYQLIPFMAFDDKQDNLDVFDKHGFRTMSATYLNEKLKFESFDEQKELMVKYLKKEMS